MVAIPRQKPPAKSSVVFAVRMPLKVLRKVVAARKRLGLTKNGFIVAAAEQVADSTK